MELALGQFHQTGLFTLWEKLCPILKGNKTSIKYKTQKKKKSLMKKKCSPGLAFTTVIINLLMAMFYNTVIAWAVYYLILSFKSVVPWKDCGKSWNTLCCLPIDNQIKHENFSLDDLNYQISSDKSFIYRVDDVKTSSIQKRIVIFNNKKTSENLGRNVYSFNSLSESFRYIDSSLNFTQGFNFDTRLNVTVNDSLEAKIDTWIRSYFILVNDTIYEAPRPKLTSTNLAKYLFDPKLLTTLIEEEITKTYWNKSVNVFLNCEKISIIQLKSFTHDI